MRLCGWIFWCWALVAVLLRAASAQPPDTSEVEYFEARIRPLLIERCFSCHSDEKQEGGLRLDSRGSILAGGESGPAAVEGQPEESLLIEAINYRGLEMPPSNRLSDAEIRELSEWIARGLPWPNSDDSITPPRPAGLEITEEDRQHWAFQPIRHAEVPNDPHSNWDDFNPIDGFVLAQLQRHDLSPSQRATKRELLRRAYFDLIGLPPTPDEMNRFLADTSVTAFERVVDELLARPQYGERWGRHWLDLVRYAQTNGYERDDEKPYIWRYRDYVIRSWNEDKPFDQFVFEQLAGDELDEVTRDSIIATGYYHLGVWDDEPDDKQQAIYDGLDDVLRTTGETFLGLTIGCARCHDHKFDPIPQADYYRLLAMVQNIAPYGKDKSATHWELNPEAVFTPLASLEEIESWLPQKTALVQQINELQTNAGATPEEQDQKKKMLAELQKQLTEPPFDRALSVRELGAATATTHVLIRGNPLTPGPEVSPAFLTVLGGEPLVSATPPDVSTGGASDSQRAALRAAGVALTTGRRRALAEWIVDTENPLTARVIVNRLWQHHFGAGIVATPNDFGRTGRPPSHPELLDWLARQLMDNGWQIKPLHRRIMLSNTYQQSSHAFHVVPPADPGNTLLWRQNLRRLEAETVRDTLLFASGQLNYEMGGRGFFPALSAEVLASQSRPGHGWENSPPRQQSRRSVYVYLKRTLGVPFLEAFDAPVFDIPQPLRSSTTIAPQALTLLNSDFVHQQSQVLAERVRQQAATTHQDWVECLYQLVLCRSARDAEREAMVAFYERRRAETANTAAEGPTAEQRALAECCRLMFNLNEFLYID